MENPDACFAGRDRREGPGPYPIEPTRVADAALAGLNRATCDFGLPWQPLELVAAVRTPFQDQISASVISRVNQSFPKRHYPSATKPTQWRRHPSLRGTSETGRFALNLSP